MVDIIAVSYWTDHEVDSTLIGCFKLGNHVHAALWISNPSIPSDLGGCEGPGW